jgi:hypothetical protein
MICDYYEKKSTWICCSIRSVASVCDVQQATRQGSDIGEIFQEA